MRHGASTSYGKVRRHWESCRRSWPGRGLHLYVILDVIVDNYMPVIEAIHEEVEDRVLVKPMTASEIARLYVLRRDLLRLRNAAGPLVDVCGG
jgi:magnesium transporter